jgi:hypothetical protein
MIDVVAIIVLLVSLGFNVWLFKKLNWQQQKDVAPPLLDAATSLHHDLNKLRNQRFSVPYTKTSMSIKTFEKRPCPFCAGHSCPRCET